MKKIRFIFDVEFDKFSIIRKIMKEEGFDNLIDFFGDFLEGIIEEKIEEEFIDVDCIARKSGFSIEEVKNKHNHKLSWKFPKIEKYIKSKKLKKEV